MSTQAIKDFLVKQLFIEKNVVTYRSLSRQFGIHVNAAKEKLACYHEKAPYDGQQSFATYLLTGQVLNPRAIPRASKGKDTSKAENAMDVDDEDDVGLDMFIPTQTDKGDDEGDVDDDDDEEEEEDYEDVMTISVRIVNERDLEDVKATYHKLTSMHVYSLSPSVIHDASHLCGPTTAIRRTDNTKGEEYAQTVGRIIAPNIHIKPLKPKDLPAVPAPSTSIKVEDPTSTSVAGRSVKAMAGQTTNSTTGSSFVKPDVEKKTTPALKKTGKADFFGVVKKKEQDKVPAVKKEEAPAKAEEKKKSGKMFFGASTSKAKETTKPVAVKKEEVDEPLTQAAKPAQRGTKRKSALELSDSENEELPKPRKTSTKPSTSKAPSPSSSRASSVGVSRPPSTAASSRRSSASSALALDSDDEEEKKQKPKAKAKVKKGVVLSDDEDEDENRVKKQSSKKEERMKRARIEEEKAAKALMDLDDDHVEHVSRRANKRSNPLANVDEDEDDEPTTKRVVKDEEADVSMEVDDEAPPREEDDDDEVISKPKPQKRKREKAPVGRNGLKKRKVMKTRKFKGEDGYMQTEDYSDWESVDEEVQEEERKPKAKPKAASKKASASKEDADEGSGSSKAPSRAPSVSKKSENKSSSSKEAKAKASAKAKPVPAKGKGQSGIRSFFNVAQK